MTCDIAYLIEPEAAMPEPAPARPLRGAPPAPQRASADPERAMASELLQAARAHDEWVRQYLGTCVVPFGADARA